MEKADFFVSGESLASPESVRSGRMKVLSRLGFSAGFRSRALSGLSGTALLAVLAACDSSDSDGVAATTMSETDPGILTFTRPDGTVVVQNFNETRVENVTTTSSDGSTVTITMFIQDTDFVLEENAAAETAMGMAPDGSGSSATDVNAFLSTTLTGSNVTYEVESVMIGPEDLTDASGNARLPDGLSLNDDGELEGTVTDDSQVGSVYNITIRARDGDGLTTAANQAFTFKLRVDNVNDVPELRVNHNVDTSATTSTIIVVETVTAGIDDQNAAIGGRFLPVSDIFKDDDGDALTFAANDGADDVATFTSAPGGLTFGATTDAQIAAASDGEARTVVLTADDGNGGEATVTFTLGGGLDFWAGSPTLASGYGFVLQNSAGGAPIFAATTGPDDEGTNADEGAQEQDIAAIPFGAPAVLGQEIRPAGDLNNDGVLDFLVSAPLATDPDATGNAVAHGAVYVIYGKPDVAGMEGEQFGTQQNYSLQLGGPGGASLRIGDETVDLEGRALELVIGGQTVTFSDTSSLSGDDISLLTGGSELIRVQSSRQVLDLGSLAAADGVAFYGESSHSPSDPVSDNAATLDNLLAARADHARAATNTSFYGFSVRAADLDGDGIGDLAIGSPRSGEGTTSTVVDERYGYYGHVFITRGAAAGFGATISDDDQITISGDLGRITYTPPTTSKDGAYTVMSGAVTYSIATYSATVDTAGNEVITSLTELATVTDKQRYEHTTRVIDPDDYLGLVGNTGDHFGQAVAAVDLDGDGIKDLVIGAPDANDGGLRAGSVYVLLGGENFESKAAGFDVSELPASAGFVIQGSYSGGYFGAFLDSAGDFNGDGIEDLVIGSPGTQAFGGTANGELRLIWGGADLADTVKTKWFEGPEKDVHLPGAVDALGDEVVLGKAQRAVRLTLDTTSTDSDAVDREVFDTQKMTSDQGIVFVGRDGAALSGWQSLGALDLNADGLDDLIVGVPYGRNGPSGRNGEAYVIYGVDDPTDLGETMRRFKTFDGLEYMAKTGMDAEDVGNFMDVVFNLEGMFADLSGTMGPAFLARPGTDDEAPTTANAPDFPASTAASPTNYGYGFTLASGQNADVLKITAPTDDSSPAMVTEIDGVMQGPADGMGIDLIGNYRYEAITGDSGGFRLVRVTQVETISGTTTTTDAFTVTVLETSTEQRVFDLSGDLEADTGFVIRSSDGNSELGFRVSAAGDVNGDGLQDFIVGARRAENADGDVTGQAYLIYGMADGMYGTDVEYQVRKISEYSVSYSPPGDNEAPYQNFSAASLISSKVVTYSDEDSAPAAGAFYSFTGDAGVPPSERVLDLTIYESLTDVTQSVLDLDDLPATAGFNIESAFGPGAVLGQSVSSAGDINGDGFDDLLVAATGGTALDVTAPADDDAALSLGVGVGSGLVQVIYGRAAFGNVSTEGMTIEADDGNPLVGTAGDDTLNGGDGTSAYYAGSGDDMINLGDDSFMRVDGGYGNDTLNFGDNDFDFTMDGNRTRVRSVETLALEEADVTLDEQLVYAITEQRRADDNKAVLAVTGSGMLALADFEEETAGSGIWESGNAVVEVTGSVVVDAS